MKKLFILSTLMFTFASAAMALDLQQARSQGLVIEQPDGYITTSSADAEVRDLVNEVNSKRKQEYERISKEKGQPIDVVGKLAADQIRAKLAK